jgi:hypothetical protein
METWTWRHGHGDMDMETWTWRHGHEDTDIETWQTENRNPGQFSLTHLLLAHRANGSLSFVCLMTRNKRKLSVCKWTCPSMNFI